MIESPKVLIEIPSLQFKSSQIILHFIHVFNECVLTPDLPNK